MRTNAALRERQWVLSRLKISMLDELERHCEWLEAQPYHASYDRPFWLLSRNAHAGRIRRYVGVVFWSTGRGWRNRKNWRERLAAVRTEVQAYKRMESV